MNQVYDKLRDNHFEIFHEVKKILTREEILNLFYKHRNAPYFAEIEEHLMTAESVVLLLVNACESIPAEEETEEDIKLGSPIVRWKQLLGNKNPEEAKIENADSLRALFGVNEIRNAFHGSDDPISANKERDVFLFPIPERPPIFDFIRTKVTMDMILSFCFPPNLEHANSTGRLDLFAMYGPIVKYHSVDYCFCRNCMRIAKEQLQISLREREAAERKKMGMTAASGMGESAMNASGAATMKGSMRGAAGAQKTVLTVRKL